MCEITAKADEKNQVQEGDQDEDDDNAAGSLPPQNDIIAPVDSESDN